MLYYLLQLLVDVRLLLVFFCVFCVTLAYVKSCKPAGLPPGPPTLPFIGNLNLLASNAHLQKTIFELGRKYGPIFSLQLGWYPAVVINDAEVLREALVKKGSQCNDRFSHAFYRKVHEIETLGVIASDGEIWRGSRKLCTNTLKDFGVGSPALEEKVLKEAEHLLSEIAKQKGKAFRSDGLLKQATANVICAMLFGKRYGYEDEDLQSILTAIDDLLTSGYELQSATLLLPFLYPLQWFRSNSRVANFAKLIKAVKKQIDEHRQNFDEDNVNDFLDVFFEGERTDGTNVIFSEKNCTRTIQNLFAAGTDTTTGTLNWILLFLLKHPEIQDRCRQDILNVVGTTRKPSMKDRSRLPYVEATLFEGLRLGSVAFHGQLHSTAGEVSLNGYNIPDDTVIIPDHYSMHMNPDLWDDPEEFRPERFIDADGKIRKPPYFVPFSVGRRACLGEQLARTELFLFLTSMLQKFVFTCDDTKKLPTLHDGVVGETLLPAKFSIIAKPLM